jgi:hypothetical protein
MEMATDLIKLPQTLCNSFRFVLSSLPAGVKVWFYRISHKSVGDGRASVTDLSAPRALSNYNNCPKI